MLAMCDAFGLVGLLLAPPIAMAIHIFLTQLVTPADGRDPAEALAPTVDELESRLDEVRGCDCRAWSAERAQTVEHDRAAWASCCVEARKVGRVGV